MVTFNKWARLTVRQDSIQRDHEYTACLHATIFESDRRYKSASQGRRVEYLRVRLQKPKFLNTHAHCNVGLGIHAQRCCPSSSTLRYLDGSSSPCQTVPDTSPASEIPSGRQANIQCSKKMNTTNYEKR